MRCASSRKLISERLDGDLGPDRAADLTEHLADCRECRAFARDLESIVSEARSLPGLEPSEQAWRRVVTGLRGQRVEEPVAAPRTFRWGPALAAAAALVVIGAGLFIGVKYRRAAAVPPDRGSAAFTMAKLREAQAYYEKAIDALSEAVGSPDSGLAPELAHVFERNLAGLDRTIQVCRQMVDRSPDDPVIRAHLLAAYREKVSLFEEIVGVGRAPADKIKPTTL